MISSYHKSLTIKISEMYEAKEKKIQNINQSKNLIYWQRDSYSLTHANQYLYEKLWNVYKTLTFNFTLFRDIEFEVIIVFFSVVGSNIE